MSEHRSFQRKIIYLILIGLLCIPLYIFGHPASIDASGVRTKGGILAQARDENHLSQATLGEIDPTSQVLELATLGFRGIAVQILWNSQHTYQMKEDWIGLSAVLEQIARLQPNFWSVWDYQSHNLSYNMSVEFDDYRDRFIWVMKGIDFLKKGLAYNATDPRFIARIGWIYGNKIGKADEHVQYRRLFRKQQEEAGEKHTDNWLVSNDWYLQAEDLVHSGRPLRVYISGEQEAKRNKPGEKAPSPLLFFSEAPMALINYSETMEEEGTFGDTAKAAWQSAAAGWNKYAQGQDLSTSYGYTIRLSEFDGVKARIASLKDQIEKLLPGEKEKAHQIKVAKLAPEEKAAMEKDYRQRRDQEIDLGAMAERKTAVSWEEVALRAPDNLRSEARQIAEEIAELEQKATTIDTYRDIVNYNYWQARCESEPTDDCLSARDLLFKAGEAYDVEGNLFKSRDLYEKSFKQWREVLDKYPVLRSNNIMADELNDEIEKYKKVIGKIPGAKMPEPFVLQDMLDLSQGKQPPPETKQQETKKPEEPKKTDEGKKPADTKKSEPPKGTPKKSAAPKDA
jgi:hypothetical protein